MHTIKSTSPRRFLTTVFTTLLGLLAVVAASAQTTVTITGTADNTGYTSDYATLDYTFGNSYTFTFVLSAGLAQNDNGETNFNSYTSAYRSESAAQGSFFTSIGGTGVSGSYATPTDTDRFQDLGVYSNGNIPYMYITAQSLANNLGLTTLNGTNAITKIEFRVNDPRVAFDYPGSRPDSTDAEDNPTYVNPATFFGTYNTFGTVTGDQANSHFQVNNSVMPNLWLTYKDGGDEYSISFSPTSISISAAAIPEPSTYAALAGLAGLGLAMLRRRRAA
ncbi:MAG: PEP-CTERM sorting domain-containing protein [Lacunisphaera sp.]|nr:PEP-CTERM sorting domain-containing protein [Lacunisphaera sp.]